jgi:hypothetical protein
MVCPGHQQLGPGEHHRCRFFRKGWNGPADDPGFPRWIIESQHVRGALAGSTRAARAAGIQQATRATAANMTGTAMKVAEETDWSQSFIPPGEPPWGPLSRPAGRGSKPPQPL